MRPSRSLVLIALLALAGPASTVPGSASASPSFTAVYPNPVATDDAGEFVVVSVPSGTDLGSLAVADGDTRVRLPNATADGRVVLSADPNATRDILDRRVFPLPDSLRLANGGEELRLYRNDTVLDTLSYSDAPEGEIRQRDGDARWRPLGATDRPVVTAGSGDVTAFVLPDSPDVALERLRRADDRILLAGYTLTSDRVADVLVSASRRNVSVRVLVDRDPVGGMARSQAAVLDRLSRAGIRVHVFGGERARYDFHHAKYAVVDDSALVTTENWKPAGVGGNGSRGWGVVTAQRGIVRGLVETFRADAGWRDTDPWTAVRSDVEVSEGAPANGSFPGRFAPRRVPVDRTRLLVAPDNAERRLLDLVGNATDSLAVEQVSLGGERQPFVRATLDAARRGVRVRVLLSGAWYVREDNERLVAWLNERADSEGLPLEARVADPRGRFEKIHAKGVVVDGDRAVVGSLNWNNNSARENREVVLVLEGGRAGDYYGRVFAADWRASAWRLSVGLAVALALVVVLALARARQIRFDARASNRFGS